MAATYPAVIPQPFAAGAAGGDRNTIPNTTVSQQRASFLLGFPPKTMTPVVAGGEPMLGPDMNGILFALSSHNYYAQTGQPYRYNADVVVDIGGYAVGTLLGSTDGAVLWYNAVAGNTTDPDAEGPGWVAMYAYGITPIPGLVGGSPRVLTLAEASKSVIVLTGTLTNNQQVVLPAQLRRWLIVNATTGAFVVTVKTASGTGVAVPQGGFNGPVEVWSDGTNVYNVVAPVNLNVDQGPSALSIAQRTNTGDLYARYFNSSAAVESFGATVIFAGTNDGFARKITPSNLQAQLPISNFVGQVTNAQVPQSSVTQHSAALFANAALTGVPTAPTAAPGTNNTQIATTGFVTAGVSVGYNQNWGGNLYGVTRIIGTGYVNGTGRPIMVTIYGGGAAGASISLVVQGQIVSLASWIGTAASFNQSICAIVPPGATYSLNAVGSVSITGWHELS